MQKRIIDYIENQEGNKFNETEIGLIPEDWEVVKLREVSDFTGGKQPPKKTFIYQPKKGYVRLLQIRDYGEEEDPTYVNTEYFNPCYVEKDDVLIARYGASVGRILRGKKGCINVAIMKTLPIEIKLIKDFLYYLLQDYRFQDYVTSLGGRSAQAGFNQGEIGMFKIPLPPLPEQKKIDRVLSKIQQAIKQQDKTIETAKNLKKSLMHKLFTEGIINGFMFDTVIFNKILDAEKSLDSLPKNFKYVVTHIQYGELNKTPNEDRRKKLLDIFFKIYSEEISTESTLLGTSILGKSKLSNNSLCEKIKLMLDRKQNKESNKNDALIAETAIKKGLILVTDDSDLLEVTQKYNGEVITLADFLYGNYRKLKETEIGVIPKSWEVVRLGDIAKTTSGGTPYRKNRRFYEGNIPWVKSGELSDNKIYNSKEKITEEGLSNSNAKILPKGTLLVAMYGATVGKTAILDIEASTNQAICAIFPKNNMFLNDYLRYYIIFTRDKLLSARYGGAQPNISQTIIRNLSFPLPLLKEQQQITYILETVDKKIEVEERRKIILKELFKTMLHKLMTGEIRLKDINI